MKKEQRILIKNFNDLWLHSKSTWKQLQYRGRTIWKNPCDLWQYQDIIQKTLPDVLLEFGTHRGGSAIWFRDQMNLVKDQFLVITIDIVPPPETLENELNIEFILGRSTAESTQQQVRDLIPPDSSVMIIEDSEHSAENVYAELCLYQDLVPTGGYFIVEDTARGYLKPHVSNTPLQGVLKFLEDQGCKDWIMDLSRENLLLTFNPSGYLRRIQPQPTLPLEE